MIIETARLLQLFLTFSGATKDTCQSLDTTLVKPLSWNDSWCTVEKQKESTHLKWLHTKLMKSLTHWIFPSLCSRELSPGHTLLVISSRLTPFKIVSISKSRGGVINDYGQIIIRTSSEFQWPLASLSSIFINDNIHHRYHCCTNYFIRS